jgi:hypothetical protein
MKTADISAARDALQRAHAALAELLSKHRDCGGPAAEILSALAEIERVIYDVGAPADGASSARAMLARQPGRNKPKRYAAQVLGGEEYLAEYREDDPRPFRTPKRVFDAVVTVLSKAKSPLLASELREAVGREVGDFVPEYLVRVCLRFLTSGDVELVHKHRTRYSAAQPRSLQQKARAAWAEAARQI